MGAYYGQSYAIIASLLQHQKWEGQKTAIWEGLSLLKQGDRIAALQKYLHILRRRGDRSQKVAALRKGMELGFNLIDTAEIYHTEDIVSEAARYFQREDLFIATKVSGAHLKYEMVLKAANRSLKNLHSSYIDLYQIHWPNPSVPIEETMRAMEKLVEDGKVRYIGVSNFSVDQLRDADNVLSKNRVASNQVEFSLISGGLEKTLLPYCERRRIAIIASQPLARGALTRPKGKLGTSMAEISKKHGGKTPSQIALNWQRMKSKVIFPIPRTSSVARVVENAGSVGWNLDEEDMRRLEVFV